MEYEQRLKERLEKLYLEIDQLKEFMKAKNRAGTRPTIEDIRDLETVKLKMAGYITLSDFYLEGYYDDEIKDKKEVTEENLRLLEEGFIEKIVELARIKQQEKLK